MAAEKMHERTQDGGKPQSGQTVLLNASFAPSLVNFRGRLIEAMVAAGHKVHVTAPDLDKVLAERLHRLGAVVHEVVLARTGLSPFADLYYVFQIWKLARRIGADLVLSYTIKPNIWASLAARIAGVRSASMVTGLGYAFIEGGNGAKRKLVARLSRLLYRMATGGNDLVVFQNPDDLKDFVAAGCLKSPSKALLVNGSGVDLQHYEVAPLPSTPIFLMISRLLINKGVREFGAAASDILARRSDCRFLLVGYLDEGPDGVGADELEQWKKSGLEFLGEVQDVRPFISQASIYVLPSYREGTPRSVLEAMAMGRPVITTDAPGCRETVTHGLNGLLVPPRDFPALVAAMELMAEDASYRAEMGRAARKLCEAKYNVDQVNAQLMRHLSL